MKLSEITPRKFVESYPGNGRKILTPTGYRNILEVHKTVKYRKFRVELENSKKLDCAYNHVLITNDGKEVYAKDSLGTIVKTIDGDSEVAKVIDLQIEEHMYDISIDSEDETYYSNGILSHNSGKSVSTAIYLSHKFNFGADINIGIVSNKGKAAAEFLANAKNILVELPVWMQQGISVWNKGSIENESKMRILTDVPTSDAFRGFTIAILVVDECVAHKEYITIRNDETGEIFEMPIGDFYSTLQQRNHVNETHKLTDKFSVLTRNGFQKFDGIKKSKHKATITITFDNGQEFECSVNHLVLVGTGYIKASELRVGDIIDDVSISNISYNDYSSNKQTLYDLLNVQGGNHYLTSGITSHNCAFIKSTVWEEFADSIFPSQSGLAWKKNIIISTAKGMNHFYQMVKSARDGSSGMNMFEVDWRDVPRYNPDGSQMTPEEFKEKIVKKHGIIYFNQNYANEFMGSSHTLISSARLSEMQASEIQHIRDAKLKVYHSPKPGHKYIMSVDPAKDGTDAFAVQIVDITDFRFIQVASAQLQIDYLLMPAFIDEWARDYNNAYLIIENNEGAGQSIADQMYQTYEYENLHFDTKTDANTKNRAKARKGYPGFRTTTKSRKQILQTLKLFIENDKLEVNDKSTITEFYQFILMNNKFQADDGAHDDMIMSLALIFVPFCSAKNFEDMKALVKNLYNDDLPQSEKVDFGDCLTIATFDDGVDDNIETKTKSTWNGFDVVEY